MFAKIKDCYYFITLNTCLSIKFVYHKKGNFKNGNLRQIKNFSRLC